MNEGPWLETVEADRRNARTRWWAWSLVKLRQCRRGARRQDFYTIGTLVRMHHPVRTDGKIQFIAEGVRAASASSNGFPASRLTWCRSNTRARSRASQDRGKSAYAMAIINTIKELLPLNPLYSEELKFFLNRFSPNEPSLLTDFAASLTTASKEELQEVLEAFNLRKRMEKVLVLLKKELEVAKLQSQIREQVEREDDQAAARVLPARAAQGDPEGTGPGQGRQDRRDRTLQRAAGQADTCPKRRKNASTRRCRSSRCSKPARRNTRSRATTSTG